jgi:sarcosine oxidase subunit alpha
MTRSIVLEEGAQIVSELINHQLTCLGHVTSSYYSPNLKKSIALAVVRSGKNMMGKNYLYPWKIKQLM